MNTINVIKWFLFGWLCMSTIIYWGGMGARTYGRVLNSYNTYNYFGLFGFCSGEQLSDFQYLQKCSGYKGTFPYLRTSRAVYAVWIFLDLVLLILFCVYNCIGNTKIFALKFSLLWTVVFLAFLSFIFLWASFIFFSNQLRLNNKGLKFSSGFGAAIGAFVMLNFGYAAVMALPFIERRMDTPKSVNSDFTQQQSQPNVDFAVPSNNPYFVAPQVMQAVSSPYAPGVNYGQQYGQVFPPAYGPAF